MANSSGRATVYVVDDDHGVRSALALLIEAHGWPVCSFDSARTLLTGGIEPDTGCLILDLQMPGMDGATLLEQLRGRGFILPAIVLTAYPAGTLAERALAAGASCVLAKPVGTAELIGQLRALLPVPPSSP